ncbi:MAG: hypothetical protein QE285_08975 [Aquabacterium sp.]|nr:hypothetical protein [Aquabacterium sp.]
MTATARTLLVSLRAGGFAGNLPQALDFLAHETSTKSVPVCMEGIRYARRFMIALRATAYHPAVFGRQGSTVLLTLGKDPGRGRHAGHPFTQARRRTSTRSSPARAARWRWAPGW